MQIAQAELLPGGAMGLGHCRCARWGCWSRSLPRDRRTCAGIGRARRQGTVLDDPLHAAPMQPGSATPSDLVLEARASPGDLRLRTSEPLAERAVAYRAEREGGTAITALSWSSLTCPERGFLTPEAQSCLETAASTRRSHAGSTQHWRDSPRTPVRRASYPLSAKRSTPGGIDRRRTFMFLTTT